MNKNELKAGFLWVRTFRDVLSGVQCYTEFCLYYAEKFKTFLN
jgi:hypothetical protein